MKRNFTAIRILTLAAFCALTFTGCKKKEPVDMSSLHTTAAAEKETMATAEQKETTAPAAESESEKAQSGYNLTTEIKKESIGSSSVEYPVISSMKDEALQEKVNALLKANATAAASLDSEHIVNITATVESINLKRITVTYRGDKTKADGSGKERIFFSNTVNLETASNLGLSDFTDPYTIAGYIASGDYKLSDAKGNESEIRSYINSSEKSTNYYYDMLKTADFTGGYDSDPADEAAAWPEIFSYEKQGVVFVALPLPSKLGSYAIIHYSPDNK